MSFIKLTLYGDGPPKFVYVNPERIESVQAGAVATCVWLGSGAYWVSETPEEISRLTEQQTDWTDTELASLLEHSPLPWRVGLEDGSYPGTIFAANGRKVATSDWSVNEREVYDGAEEDLAWFIVRAVNRGQVKP